MQYTWNLALGTLDFFTSAAYTDEWWIEPPFERESESSNFQRTITTTEPRLFGVGVRYHIQGGI